MSTIRLAHVYNAHGCESGKKENEIALLEATIRGGESRDI